MKRGTSVISLTLLWRLPDQVSSAFLNANFSHALYKFLCRKAGKLQAKVVVVALDLPTSWAMLTATADDFRGRMFTAINDMLLDMLAAIARKDYEDRRRRQSQGIEKAVAEGKYRGKPEDTKRNARIAQRLREGASWSDIAEIEQCSRDTIARASRKLKAEPKEAMT